MPDPETCTTMTDVRMGVDAIDRELVRLIGLRFRHMDAAARIKANRSAVRDEGRKAQVLENVRRLAAAGDWPPELAERLWDQLVEASIAYEFEAFDRIRG